MRRPQEGFCSIIAKQGCQESTGGLLGARLAAERSAAQPVAAGLTQPASLAPPPCRARQLLHFFPSSHTLSLMSQPWEGDVSMVLPWSALPFKRAAVNLTREELVLAAQEVHTGWLPGLCAC